jgi:hypothetical protein
MQVEPRVRFQPGPSRRDVYGWRKCQDHMHGKCFWYLTVNGAEEFEELLMPVPGHAGPDHLTGRHVQRGEQCGGPVPLVAMGNRLRTTGIIE